MRFSAAISLPLAMAAALGTAHAEVTVSGNVRVDAASIRAHVPAGPDGRITDAGLDDAVKSIFSSGQFDDVKVERTRKGVSVIVVERPVVSAVRFEGNSKLKEAELREVAGLKPGQPLAEGDVEAAVLALTRRYSNRGYVEAAVSERRERTGADVSVTFTVVEGKKTGVGHVWFKGNESFPASRLRSVVSTKESGWFGWLRTNDVYDPDRVDADREALRRFYVSQGFADAVVRPADVDLLEDGFAVGFEIEEGPRYVVSSVTVDSTVPGFGEDLHPSMKRLEGSRLDPAALAKAASDAEDSAIGTGVRAPVVEPRVSRMPGGVAEVTFTADEAPRVYIDRIEVEGNGRTREEVIRRELDFAEGDILDRALLRRAERRLKALGLFEKVSFTLLPGSAEDRAVLRIVAEDRKTGEFSVGGGYSTREGPLASVSVSQANIAGTGRKGRLHASRGERSSSYGASFTEPYLFGHRISGTADAFHERAGRESFSRNAYDEQVTGARFTLAAPLAERFGGTIGYRIEQRQISSVDPLYSGTGLPGDPDLVAAGRFLKSAAFWSLDYDALDDAADPRHGYRLGFRQEIAGLGGDVRFLKSEGSAEWYRHLVPARDLVGRLAARGGVISGLGAPLSFQDHFAGGSDVVRGFARDGFGPRDASTGFHLGGTAFASATAEAAMPLPFIPPHLGFKGAVFADVGAVWSPDARKVAASGADVAGDDAALRAAVGTGILWNSPFGLLRADFAVPVVSRDGDRAQVFTFTGGTRF